MVSKRKKRRTKKEQSPNTASVEPKNEGSKKESKYSGLERIYHDHYKTLLLIPFAMLLISIIYLGSSYLSTGELIQTGVSLKGGVTITVPTSESPVDVKVIESRLESEFPENDILVREIAELGTQQAVSVEIAPGPGEDVEKLQDIIVPKLSEIAGVPQDKFGVEVIGPSLGKSFLKQTITALIVAFLFMALTVFFYFRTFVPSFAVVLAAFSDMVVALAVVSAMGIKLSTAGIAAFLMLIGYSVDTDILMSTRVLKRREGTVYERIKNSISTGLLMNLTTLAAIVSAIIITQSVIIKQIMIILLVGLLADIINTWIQNAGILRWYAEKKNL